MSDPIAHVARRLRNSNRIAIVTGAGISAESGLRTFRETMEGLWKEFDPQKLATPEAFLRDPATVTRWYDHRRMGCLAAEPNPGHLALAAMEKRLESVGGECIIFTQNVDRLHQRAGSEHVVELHGSIVEWRCIETGEVFEPPHEPFTVFPPPSPFAPDGILRPNVVWFGEALPEQALQTAFRFVPQCDLFFSIGTSSVVYPAAGFVDLAADAGAFTVEINKDDTPASRRVDVTIRGSAGAVMPAIVHAAWGDPLR